MKKNYSGKIAVLLLMLAVVFSCKEKTKSATNETAGKHVHEVQTKYTCPMHPQIVRDQPGQCPICGMDLVPMSSSNELHLDSSLLPLLKPVNEQVVSSISTIAPGDGSRIFTAFVQGIVTYDTRNRESISSRVAGRIERMYVKYNFQPVRKGQLIMEIYSPDLASAQRELIYISRSGQDAGLLQRARQRLSLLGMQAAQIDQVIKSGKPLYRVPVYSTVSGYIVEKNASGNVGTSVVSMPSASSEGMGGMSGNDAANTTTVQPNITPAPLLIREGQYVGAGETVFTIYKDNSLVAEFSFEPGLASEIQRGQKLLYHTLANPDEIKSGVIGLIEPRQKAGESFIVARVYVSPGDLKPGQLLTANIPVVKSNAFWLPQNAVLQLGRKAVVFKKENGVFIPKEVQTGIRVGGMIEIKNDIGDWQVAKDAGFMVDSESFIRLNSKN